MIISNILLLSFIIFVLIFLDYLYNNISIYQLSVPTIIYLQQFLKLST